MNQDAIQVQTFIFNLRSLTKAFHEVFRNYGPFYTQVYGRGLPYKYHLYCGNLYSTFGAPLPFIKSTLKLELALHSVPHLQK